MAVEIGDGLMALLQTLLHHCNFYFAIFFLFYLYVISYIESVRTQTYTYPHTQDASKHTHKSQTCSKIRLCNFINIICARTHTHTHTHIQDACTHTQVKPVPKFFCVISVLAFQKVLNYVYVYVCLYVCTYVCM